MDPDQRWFEGFKARCELVSDIVAVLLGLGGLWLLVWYFDLL